MNVYDVASKTAVREVPTANALEGICPTIGEFSFQVGKVLPKFLRFKWVVNIGKLSSFEQNSHSALLTSHLILCKPQFFSLTLFLLFASKYSSVFAVLFSPLNPEAPSLSPCTFPSEDQVSLSILQCARLTRQLVRLERDHLSLLFYSS